MSGLTVNGSKSCTDLVPYTSTSQASAQAQSSSSAQKNQNEQAASQTPLFEGCPLPSSIQALAVSYLNYSHEAHFPNKSMNFDELEKFNAAPGEATIDRLCEKVGGTWLQVIKTLHERPHCAAVTIAPRSRHESLFDSKNHAKGHLGCNLSPEQALQSCDQFTLLNVAYMDYSGEELQMQLKGRKIDYLTVYDCLNVRNLSLNLPQTKIIFVAGCNIGTIDVRQCASLKYLTVTAALPGTKIDIRGLNCVAHAEAKLNGRISIHATNAKGNEIEHHGQGTVGFVSKKKEEPQS